MAARKLICIILAILTAGSLTLGLAGCASKYRMDYDGQKKAYFGAQDEYRAGEEIDLYYMFIATDTDYAFYLDGQRLDAEYVEGKGYRLRFAMPDHDATLRCEASAASVYNPYPAGEMVLDFYYATEGSDSYNELVLYGYSSSEVTLCVYYGTVTGSETRTDYLIPIEVVNECFELIAQSGMEDWETLEEPTALEGQSIVCKYRKEDGSYVRASSEVMAPDGEAVFTQISKLLESCMTSQYII